MNVYFDYDANPSFRKMSCYLRGQRISNFNFMLKLYNKELAKIDPYNESLSTEEKYMIIEECKKNIWYFFRVVLRSTSQGGGTNAYELNRGNMTTIYSYDNSTGLLKNQIRTTLATFTNISIAVYASIFRQESSLFICKDVELSNFLSYKIDNHIVLPSYIKTLLDRKTIMFVPSTHIIQFLDTNFYKDYHYSNYFFEDYEFINKLAYIYDKFIDIENHLERKVFFSSVINDNINYDELYMLQRNSISISEVQLYDRSECISFIRNLSKCIFAMKFNTIGLDISKELADDFFKMFNKDKDVYRREVLLSRENDITY